MTQNKALKPVGWYCPECKIRLLTKIAYGALSIKCKCQKTNQSKWIRMYVKEELL